MSTFVVLEGIDGSGKSSVIDSIKEDHPEYHYTREPSNSEPGRLAKKAEEQHHSPYLDLFLYLADRVEHTEEIENKLENGGTVVCDRYWGSTSAYQAASEEISLEYTESIQKPIILKPDITILFDISPEASLERITERKNKSKYEQVDFLEKVRENYLKLAKKYDWEVIDAQQNPEDVLADVKESIYREID